MVFFALVIWNQCELTSNMDINALFNAITFALIFIKFRHHFSLTDQISDPDKVVLVQIKEYLISQWIIMNAVTLELILLGFFCVTQVLISILGREKQQPISIYYSIVVILMQILIGRLFEDTYWKNVWVFGKFYIGIFKVVKFESIKASMSSNADKEEDSEKPKLQEVPSASSNPMDQIFGMTQTSDIIEYKDDDTGDGNRGSGQMMVNLEAIEEEKEMQDEKKIENDGGDEVYYDRDASDRDASDRDASDRDRQEPIVNMNTTQSERHDIISNNAGNDMIEEQEEDTGTIGGDNDANIAFEQEANANENKGTNESVED